MSDPGWNIHSWKEQKRLDVDRIYERVVLATCAFAIGVLARDVAQDYRDMRLAQKKPAQSQIEPAPIWSKKCKRLGKQLFATKADADPWIGKCVTAGVRT